MDGIAEDQAAVAPLSSEQIATPPASPPQFGGKQVQVLYGPWAGSVVILPEADADQAIADKWAIEPAHPPLDVHAEPVEPLTDEEAQAASDAATEYAANYSGAGEEAGGDTAPAPSSAAQAASFDSVGITFDQALDSASVPPASAFTLTANTGPLTITTASVAGSVVTLTLDAAASGLTSITAAYAPGSPPLQGTGGIAVAAFSDFAVTPAAGA